MFNLERAITEWRQQMLAAGIKTPVPLEELENHLHEDIAQQMQSGIAAQSAFELAVQRIGHAGTLKKEFAKTSVYGQPLRPQHLRIYCYVVALSMLLVNLGMLAMNEISPIELAGGVLLALYTGSLPRWHSLLANPRNRLVRAALLIGGFFVLTWPLWAMLDLLPSGIVGNMIISSILPAWFAMGLAYMVYGQADTAEQIGSTSGKKKEQYV
jgi:hypothetical protein